MSGFFFGNTDYDEYYYQNVENVRDFCKKDLIPEFKKLNSDEYIEFSTWY